MTAPRTRAPWTRRPWPPASRSSSPSTTRRPPSPATFLRARFAAGLAWVHYPAGLGGLGAEHGLQAAVDRAFAEAGAPDNRPRLNVIGLGMAAPMILRYGTTPQQRERWLPSLWTGEDIWCQLFSEPGAGSDLAGVGTSAVRDGDAWVLNGQKVWTSMAHHARWGILLARTDPEAPKHRGLTYFVDRHDRARRRGPRAAADHRRGRVQRGLPDRRPHPRRPAPRRGRPGLGRRAVHADERARRDRRRHAAPRERRRRRPRRALARAPRGAHPRPARPDARLWVRDRGRAPDRGAPRPAAGRGPAGSGGLRRQDHLRPPQPGVLEPRARAAGRGRPALPRLHRAPPRDRGLRRPATPAGATCASAPTPSRAAHRRSCATSSPSACSACPPSPVPTRTSRGRTCPDERHPSRRHAHHRRPPLLRHRGRPARERPRAASTSRRPGTRSSPAPTPTTPSTPTSGRG